MLGSVLGVETLESIARAYLSRPLTGFAGVFGAVNLVWAARLFVVSIQRGLRTVWADSGSPRPVRENVLTFVLEFVFLFGIVALLAASQAARIVVSAVRDQAARGALLDTFRTASSILPHLALGLFAYATYRTIPPVRPRHAHCLLGAALCASGYAVFLAFVGTLRNAARYDLLYGVMGNLILGLITVYMFFSLYFFSAAFVYVLGSFDAFLLGRYLRRSRKKAPSTAAAPESSLAARLPYRLLRHYGRDYGTGETLFRTGDQSSDVYLLLYGEVGIYQEPRPGRNELRVSVVRPGEFFGETSYLLEEHRTATARAETPASVLALPVKVFERFLTVDTRASRRLARLLSTRLSEMNRRAAAHGRDSLCPDDGLETDAPEAGGKP